jgi:CBS domain-containing protein
MSAVHKILEKKGKPLLTITPETSVYHALESLATHNIGALVVKDGDRFCGVFTERDYARKVVLQDRNSRETTVKEIIDNDCETVSPSASIKDCMTLMTANSIRYLPVIDNGNILGIISVGDVVKYIIEDQAFVLQQMENYINQ